MAVNYARLFHRRATPQSQPIPGSTQVPNRPAAMPGRSTDWTGRPVPGPRAEGGTYYIAERDLIKESHAPSSAAIQATASGRPPHLEIRKAVARPRTIRPSSPWRWWPARPG